MKMVTTKQAQDLLEKRGVKVSYPTLAQWTREGKFSGAEIKETERGPVWYIPLASVEGFEPPKMGRPPKPSTTEKPATRQPRASNEASTKKKGKK
jgi:hypothetical protein